MEHDNHNMASPWQDILGLARILRDVEQRLAAIEEYSGEIFDRLDIIESARNISYAKWVQESEFQSDRSQYVDLPIKKIIDIYSETPQMLQYCSKTASPKVVENAVILERNSAGNYWVIELACQEFILLPKPTALSCIRNHESLNLLYQLIGEATTEASSTYWIESPAYLFQLTRHKRWALKAKGAISCDKNPLYLNWHAQLASIQSRYVEIEAKLDKLVDENSHQANKKDYKSRLAEAYGNPVNVFASTCAPQAYAIYHDSTRQGMVLVECHVDVSIQNAITPASDKGVFVGTSPFTLIHGGSNVNFRRSKADARLPSQMCLLDADQQTWIMMKDYDDASKMLRLLDGWWGPLEIE